MNIRGARFLVGLAGLLILGSPVWAQSASPADDDENIVVTGKAATSTEVSRQARAITDMSSAIRHEPMARFQDKLCPGVMGLQADAAGLMIDRLRDNASLLGLGLTNDDGTCRPNFIVAFVENGQESLQQIADRDGWAFQDMSPSERRKLLSEEGPVRVWTITQTRTRDGVPVPRGLNPSDPPQVNGWMAHSKIYLAIREDITRVVVLFDREGVRGKTLLQLADYATMRGLARTRPVDGEGHPMDTILALFDPSGSPPAKLTEFDQAYLAAVYDGMPNIPGVTKVLGVNRQLRLQTGEPEPAGAEARE
jgi:hypothetical protein